MDDLQGNVYQGCNLEYVFMVHVRENSSITVRFKDQVDEAKRFDSGFTVYNMSRTRNDESQKLTHC